MIQSDWYTLLALFWPLLCLYFLPLVVACCRHHPQALAIGMLNLLFGWTMLGWAAALIWACTAVRPRAITTDAPRIP